jgi:pilus assembly protein Flp/PilA
MNKLTVKKLARRLLADETGGEIIEYALILGLIIVGAIVVIGAYGTKVLGRWQNVDSSFTGVEAAEE